MEVILYEIFGKGAICGYGEVYEQIAETMPDGVLPSIATSCASGDDAPAHGGGGDPVAAGDV
jgi:hypothetical protein